jgi:prepilin-type N-terminal cleavage/methylation domain-containing protein
MNKNKGFTLIELLVTIGLIAIISTLIVVNMTGIQTKESSSEYTKFQDQLTSAGCSFIDADVNNISRVKCKNGATCEVPLSLLVSEGLIDADMIDPQTNKKVSEEQDDVYIKVAWTENDGYKEKTCSFVSGTTSNELPTNTTSAPVCKNPEVPTTVQIDPVTITYGCSDTSVDGCMSKDETKTYTETTKETLKWTIEDYYNLKTDCSYDVNLTIDTTSPTISAVANPLSLGDGQYDFKSNVKATFGPAGGTVTCNPAMSKKSGSYDVTCTATPNNRKSAVSTTFSVRHSYPGTYHPCQKNCECVKTSSDGCSFHGDYTDDIGRQWGTCNCGGYTFTGTNCSHCVQYGNCQDCSYYTCPQGGNPVGNTCYY